MTYIFPVTSPMDTQTQGLRHQKQYSIAYFVLHTSSATSSSNISVSRFTAVHLFNLRLLLLSAFHIQKDISLSSVCYRRIMYGLCVCVCVCVCARALANTKRTTFYSNDLTPSISPPASSSSPQGVLLYSNLVSGSPVSVLSTITR